MLDRDHQFQMACVIVWKHFDAFNSIIFFVTKLTTN
jgi:hypothetical protein